jgi:hypothetical protein
MYDCNFAREFTCLKQIVVFSTQSSHVVLCRLIVQNFVLTKVTVTRQDAEWLLKPLILTDCNLPFCYEEYLVNFFTRLKNFLTWLKNASMQVYDNLVDQISFHFIKE